MAMPWRAVQALVLALALCGIAFAAGPEGVWLNVPFVKQTKDGCGAASIAMVMQYWQHQQRRPGGDISAPDHILRALYSSSAHGIYASAMQRYFQQHGFRAFAFHGDLAMLAEHLEKGRPLIVALKPAGDASLHYVVVAGLDPANRLVIVNDPAQRKLLKDDQLQFNREWKATGNWTLLAVPEPDTAK
jgi:ABC-type bacteriocin/lantibiotic exporter with double-glycine peptidase domain